MDDISIDMVIDMGIDMWMADEPPVLSLPPETEGSSRILTPGVQPHQKAEVPAMD